MIFLFLRTHWSENQKFLMKIAIYITIQSCLGASALFENLVILCKICNSKLGLFISYVFNQIYSISRGMNECDFVIPTLEIRQTFLPITSVAVFIGQLATPEVGNPLKEKTFIHECVFVIK